MNLTSTTIEMGFTKESFSAGTHMCLIYSDDNERLKIVGKFLERGIVAKEKVGYFADIMKPEEVRDWLLNMGVELPKENGFSIFDAENTFCPDGKFVPEEMLNTVRTVYENAKNAGYINVRFSAEMSWALKGIPGSDRLMEFESLMNEVVKTHPVTPICQYDANKFSGAAILNILKVHPMMIVHGQIVQNPYYMKPKDFLDGICLYE